MSKRRKKKNSLEAEIAPVADGDVLGYMCEVDFSIEMGASPGGTSIYFTADDCRKHRGCVTHCGMIEVRLRFLRLIETPTENDFTNRGYGGIGESHCTCFITKQDFDSNLGKVGKGILGYASAKESLEYSPPGAPVVEIELRLRKTVLSGRI